MIQSPADECPVGTMPQATDKEHDQGVADHFPTGTSASSQWEIDIIPEPGHQRDMPPAPELRDGARLIGEVEVAHQVDAKESCRTDGHV